MDYKIVLETFEGPLDLLLHLIEKAKVDIYDIPISDITDQYMDYLNNMKELDLEIASDFLVMASTLLEIKSKMLLPAKNNENEDRQLEMEEIDPRIELVRRLVEYKKYKKVAEELKIQEINQNKVFYKPKEEFAYTKEEDLELENLNVDELVKVLNKVLSKRDKKSKPINIDEIQRDEITLEECINRIKSELNEKEKILFSSLFDENSSRSEIIGTFLSILELTKSKYIKVKQENNFSDIVIIKI
ncbi:segregation and condensation protein A [Anaerosalibacter sp. Marseille-P3206]|uniref:segregation and condensation protein A n=1 Tax=Anaerosalibacter sp. Marseille-P3206 TaxID=1871005 RepID=UPI000985919B|nr:segregation/condensation protein A [Anaerosalibacter sp. Marseille-P3206]